MFSRFAIAAAVGIFAAGCHTDMWVQPRERPLQTSDFFRDGTSARPLPEGAIARGHLKTDTAYFTGRDDSGKYITEIPVGKAMAALKIDDSKEFLLRGQEMFNAFCSPCHGRVGDGQGMIAKRGLDLVRQPANYHSEKLRKMPIGHFFDVATNGFGIMYPYKSRISVEDRWAIVAYIRTLQASQMNVKYEEERP